MDTVRKLAYSKPPIGMYFEDTDLNTLDKNSYMLLTMFEVMSVDDGGAKQNAPCSLAKYLQLREKTTPQKKSIKSKEDENHE
jgi:hypothetical protein